jgi:hypothetical protein
MHFSILILEPKQGVISGYAPWIRDIMDLKIANLQLPATSGIEKTFSKIPEINSIIFGLGKH